MKPLSRRRFLGCVSAAGLTLPLSDALADFAGGAAKPLPDRRQAAIHALCLGHICRTKGEVDQALAHFTGAIEMNGDLAISYTERAVLFDDLGHHEQATLDYQRGYDLLNEISREGGERRQDVLRHSRQVARALAHFVRDDVGDRSKLYALECWLRTYELQGEW